PRYKPSCRRAVHVLLHHLVRGQEEILKIHREGKEAQKFPLRRQHAHQPQQRQKSQTSIPFCFTHTCSSFCKCGVFLSLRDKYTTLLPSCQALCPKKNCNRSPMGL